MLRLNGHNDSHGDMVAGAPVWRCRIVAGPHVCSPALVQSGCLAGLLSSEAGMQTVLLTGPDTCCGTSWLCRLASKLVWG
jgi:hypothetical protein